MTTKTEITPPDGSLCPHYQQLDEELFEDLFSEVAKVRSDRPDLFRFTHRPITVFEKYSGEEREVSEGEILSKFLEQRQRNLVTIIDGNVGTGKSELCAYLSLELKEAGRDVLHIDKNADLLTIMAEEIPEFYERVMGGMDPGTIGLGVGASTAAAGLVAIPLGGFLSDRLEKWTAAAPAIVGALGLFLSTVPVYFALTVVESTVSLGGLDVRTAWIFVFLAVSGVFLNTGPIYQAVMEVVSVQKREAALAFCVILMHLVGSATATPIIGLTQDTFSPTAGMLLSVPVLIAGALFWIGSIPGLGYRRGVAGSDPDRDPANNGAG